MSQTIEFPDSAVAIRSASALTEVTFLRVGQSLEASIEVLGTLTARFAAVLAELEGDNLSQSLRALQGTASRVEELDQIQLREGVRISRMKDLAETIGGRIAQMKTSLKDVGSLAVNSKIAAANIRVPGGDFTSFANEIGRTLEIAKSTLDQFSAELRTVREHVSAAHSGQVRFAAFQREAARSITERLSTTVKSIALQHQRAARASLQVKLGGTRIHQRICNAIVALQIGDITRQRLDHADAALGLVAGADAQSEDADEALLIAAAHRVQSAQLTDAARNFDREVRQITDSLNGLATEAGALRDLGDATYGSAEHGDGNFIKDLEGEVGEALALFEAFETARTEIAGVTAKVSDAAAGLCRHLRTVQSLEADIRIMGLNTTFKCARIGREGLALSIIAQELRVYANGFAKEAGALMTEVETVAGISGDLLEGMEAERVPLMIAGARAMRDSLATLRQMGGNLDVAMGELKADSDRVAALLVTTVAELQGQNEIGQTLRDAARNLTARLPSAHLSLANLPPRVERMLQQVTATYTMESERAVHDRVLGRTTLAAAVVEAPELEDFLF